MRIFISLSHFCVLASFTHPQFLNVTAQKKGFLLSFFLRCAPCQGFNFVVLNWKWHTKTPFARPSWSSSLWRLCVGAVKVQEMRRRVSSLCWRDRWRNSSRNSNKWISTLPSSRNQKLLSLNFVCCALLSLPGRRRKVQLSDSFWWRI